MSRGLKIPTYHRPSRSRGSRLTVISNLSGEAAAADGRLPVPAAVSLKGSLIRENFDRCRDLQIILASAAPPAATAGYPLPTLVAHPLFLRTAVNRSQLLHHVVNHSELLHNVVNHSQLLHNAVNHSQVLHNMFNPNQVLHNLGNNDRASRALVSYTSTLNVNWVLIKVCTAPCL